MPRWPHTFLIYINASPKQLRRVHLSAAGQLHRQELEYEASIVCNICLRVGFGFSRHILRARPPRRKAPWNGSEVFFSNGTVCSGAHVRRAARRAPARSPQTARIEAEEERRFKLRNFSGRLLQIVSPSPGRACARRLGKPLYHEAPPRTSL